MKRVSTLDPNKEQTAIYKFGLLEPLEGMSDETWALFRKQNELWNQLVEIDRQDRAAYEQIRLDANPEYRQLATEKSDLEALINSAKSEKRAARQAARTKRVDVSELDRVMREANDRKKAIMPRIKELRASLKTQMETPVEDLKDKKELAIKEAKQKIGLWWPNENMILDRYRNASGKAKKEGGTLRFRGFDGTGSFCFQANSETYRGKTISKISGKECEIPQLIRIDPIPNQDLSHLSAKSRQHRARHLLTLTIDRGSKANSIKTMTWPIVFHRNIPDDSMIGKVTVIRTRSGKKFRWDAIFQVRDQVPQTPLGDHQSSAMCGIDPGWRLEEDGSLRVLTLCRKSSTDPKTGQTRFAFDALHLPAALIQKMDRVEETQSALSLEANVAWKELYPLIKNTDGDTDVSEIKRRMLNAAQKLSQKQGENNAPARSMESLFRYYMRHPDIAEAKSERECVSILNQWMERTAKRTQQNQNTRRRCRGWREHIYRNFAATIAKKYLYIHLEDTPLSDLALNKKRPSGDGNDLHKAARNQRQRAALYSLFLAIKNACRKSGSTIHRIPPTDTSVICSSCGADNREQVEDDLFWTCGGCGKLHHRDENAAQNIFQAPPLFLEKKAA